MMLIESTLSRLAPIRQRLRSFAAVLWQLAKEIFLPLLVATAWTGYNLFDDSKPAPSIQSILNLFGVTLISVSYFFAQLYRIAKQQRVDRGLRKIEDVVDRTLNRIEQRTDDIIAHITGGDSACYLFGPTPEGNRWRGLMVVHIGKHPLYELTVRICDLDEFEKIIASRNGFANLAQADHTFSIGSLTVNYARFCDDIILGDGDSRRFNIFFHARNGEFTQELRCKKVDGAWVFATRTRRSDVLLHEIVQPDFPRGANGEVNW